VGDTDSSNLLRGVGPGNGLQGAVNAYVALGSNLGASLKTVEAALQALAALPQTQLLRASSLYRSAPVQAIGPDFINAVALLQTLLSPLELLAALQTLETQFGRIREYPHKSIAGPPQDLLNPLGGPDAQRQDRGYTNKSTPKPPQDLLNPLGGPDVQRQDEGHVYQPRTLDLDLLCHGHTVMQTDHLTLPHPRLHERAFVLLPLAEIDPEFVIPGRVGLAHWLQTVSAQQIEKLEPRSDQS
jgi:2-amino-4-hydroxy-6-hydroxymethyldihydropteridine diphosphokinase